MALDFITGTALGGVVTFLGNRLLEKLKSKHSLTNEQYKIQLKKSEFFFQEQFKAAVKFGQFFNSIFPEKDSYLMLREYKGREIVNHFEEYKVFIDNFINDFDVLFSEDIIALLYQSKHVIITYYNDLSIEQCNGYDSKSLGNIKWKYGEEFYTIIESCRNAIKQIISEQVKF